MRPPLSYENHQDYLYAGVAQLMCPICEKDGQDCDKKEKRYRLLFLLTGSQSSNNRLFAF